VGALVEGPGFYPYLSGRRNLGLFDAAGPGGRPRDRRARIEEALALVGMADVDRRPVKHYSLGMRQRLGLAAALLRRPRLLVLDEPTNGLDPNGIRELRELFVTLTRSGTTVVLSSHQLAEVELICTRAAVMVGGRVVAQDSVERLLAPTGVVVLTSPDLDALESCLVRLRRPRLLDRSADRARIALGGLPSETLVAALVADGLAVRELVVERRTLEDVFVGLTGGETA
jgi:ABC-2 type transport system ATP-binding protein